MVGGGDEAEAMTAAEPDAVDRGGVGTGEGDAEGARAVVSAEGVVVATRVLPANQLRGKRARAPSTAAACQIPAVRVWGRTSRPTGARLRGGGGSDMAVEVGAKGPGSSRHNGFSPMGKGGGVSECELGSSSGLVSRSRPKEGESSFGLGSQTGGGRVVMPTAGILVLSRRTRGSWSGGTLQAREECPGRVPAQKLWMLGGKVRSTVS